MDFDDDTPEEVTEVGSDELLSDDDLRLPEGANPLVRLHAVRSWLTRRQKLTNIEIGEAALELQHLQQDESGTSRLRRRELQARQEQMQHLQQKFRQAQQRLAMYEEAETLLQECVDHTTVGERLLVEYYLTLEEQVQNSLQAGESEASPRLQALQDVQHRVERVSVSGEE
jgi:Fe2+ transport system protein B